MKNYDSRSNLGHSAMNSEMMTQNSQHHEYQSNLNIFDQIVKNEVLNESKKLPLLQFNVVSDLKKS